MEKENKAILNVDFAPYGRDISVGNMATRNERELVKRVKKLEEKITKLECEIIALKVHHTEKNCNCGKTITCKSPNVNFNISSHGDTQEKVMKMIENQLAKVTKRANL